MDVLILLLSIHMMKYYEYELSNLSFFDTM